MEHGFDVLMCAEDPRIAGAAERLRDAGTTVEVVRADMEDTKVAQGKQDDPAEVAKEGFEAMMKGKDSVIAASVKSKLQRLANELLPETAKARMNAAANKPGSGAKS